MLGTTPDRIQHCLAGWGDLRFGRSDSTRPQGSGRRNRGVIRKVRNAPHNCPTTANGEDLLATQSSLQPRCNRQSQSRRSPGVRAEGQRAHFMPRTLRPVPGARDEILGNPCVERQDSKPSGTPGTAVKVSSTLCARKRSAMQGVPDHARARSAAHVGVRATSGPHRTTWPLRPRSTVCRQARWPQSDEQRAVL